MAEWQRHMIESRKLGYLLWSDVIKAEQDELLYVGHAAGQTGCSTAATARRRLSVIPVAGRSAIRHHQGPVGGQHADGGFISRTTSTSISR